MRETSAGMKKSPDLPSQKKAYVTQLFIWVHVCMSVSVCLHVCMCTPTCPFLSPAAGQRLLKHLLLPCITDSRQVVAPFLHFYSPIPVIRTPLGRGVYRLL